MFVKSFGCQMNVYDSQRMADVAGREGYGETERVEDADLVILNTCHIRERASEKIYSELGKIREIKEARAAEGRETTLVVAGCVAQAEGREIIRRQKAVDLVVGPLNYHRLPALLEAARAVVPYTRGSETSRPAARVIDEIRRLADMGAREFTIIGQNVNAYHGLDAGGAVVDLAGLLARAARIPGVLRLRYSTSHPLDMSDDLIRAHAENPALAPYLHLPIQSGSDRILDAMNRRHTARDYLDAIARVRAVRPDIALSSDFIVGFPGESDADFQATLDLVDEVGFASAFAFKYSARPGTPAAELGDQVAAPVKVERLARLQARLEAQRQAFNAATVGRRFGVVFDKPGRHEGQLIGRSPYMQSVNAVVDSGRIGEMTEVEITGVKPNSLTARVVSPPQGRAS